MRKAILLLPVVLVLLLHYGCNSLQSQEKKAEKDTSPKIEIGLEGNAYITDTIQSVWQRRQRRTREDEYSIPMIPGRKVSVFFRVNATGKMHVYLRAKSENPVSLKVGKDALYHSVNVDAEMNEVFCGTFKINKEGYQRIDVERSFSNSLGRIDLYELIVSGNAVNDKEMNYVHDFSTHFGQRGPSVHLNYTLPEVATEYFYSEITIPKGNDVVGSYFMANGFGQGYFGIQVNSVTERRILFSVWSPFKTDKPGEVPGDQRVVYLRRGENVKGLEFGGEGSGGQSYMIFPWKAGVTYSFLTRIHPDGKGNSIYTSYFYDSENEKWMLMASFLRPKTDTYFTRAHSFLENFNPRTGWQTRQGHFGNQWAYGTDGKWREVTAARFTYDATARAGMRTDYRGGLAGSRFFLQNCGFFDKNTDPDTEFTRPAAGIPPEIDFEALEAIPGVDVNLSENGKS